MNLKKIFHHFTGLIYPNICCVCNKELKIGESVICMNCLFHIPRTNYHLQPNNELEKRFWGKVAIEHATAFYFFQKGSDYQKILHKLKYKKEQEIGHIFGKYAGVELLESENFRHFDYIVPIPLHKKKLAKRGYNQSELIANGLSEVMQVPIETKTLYRAIENPTQTKKNVYERWQNSEGIFALKNQDTFAGKHVLLVDDVLTTGSTLIAAAKAIHQSPDAKVSIFTLAAA